VNLNRSFLIAPRFSRFCASTGVLVARWTSAEICCFRMQATYSDSDEAWLKSTWRLSASTKSSGNSICKFMLTFNTFSLYQISRFRFIKFCLLRRCRCLVYDQYYSPECALGKEPHAALQIGQKIILAPHFCFCSTAHRLHSGPSASGQVLP